MLSFCLVSKMSLCHISGIGPGQATVDEKSCYWCFTTQPSQLSQTTFKEERNASLYFLIVLFQRSILLCFCLLSLTLSRMSRLGHAFPRVISQSVCKSAVVLALALSTVDLQTTCRPTAKSHLRNQRAFLLPVDLEIPLT